MIHTPALSEAELTARLCLHSLPAIGAQRFNKLIECFASAENALRAPKSDWRALGIPVEACNVRHAHETKQQVAEAIDWLKADHHHLLMWDAPNYPTLLSELPDAPPLLFVAGSLEILERPQLAIVGSRQASAPGLDNARAFAKSLAAGGFVITSGLALGIDGAAHQGALNGGGQTVAVLGTGLKQIYPRQHLRLSEAISEQGGALVSELPLDSPPQGRNFPRRNRIISGLSLGVLVIEASPNSGSLITARLAAEQGRSVWALPGSIHHPGARGCHLLIREGATLVESTTHILEDLQGWQPVNLPPMPNAQAKTSTEHAALLNLLSAAPMTSESLAEASNLPLPQVLAALTELEIAGQVANAGGRWLLRPPS